MTPEQKAYHSKYKQLILLLDQIDCTLDKQHQALAEDNNRKILRMIAANDRRIAKVTQLHNEIKTLADQLQLPDFSSSKDTIDQRIKTIHQKFIKNMQHAKALLEISKGRLKNIRQGQSKVINGYLKRIEQQYGYYIDTRVR